MNSITILSDLQTIETRLENEGDTLAVRKAFWRIIGTIKRMEPNEVSDEVISKATEIRNRLFKKDTVLGVGQGLVIFLFVFVFAMLGYIWLLLYVESTLSIFIILSPLILMIVLNILLLIICVFVAYGSYPWGRYFGGVIARVKFDGFYRYSPGELGLKIEYTSYLRTSQSRRKWVYGFPIVWVFGSLFILLPISWFLNPRGIWAPLIIIILFAIFYVAIYYRKTGELHRFMREFRIDRELKKKRKTKEAQKVEEK